MMEAIARIAKALVLLLLLGAAWIWWDVHRLRAFCDEVHAGLPLSTLAEVAQRHSVAPRWVARQGVFDAQSKDWVMFVPAASTMGDVVCAIHHDRAVVVGRSCGGTSG